MCAALLVAAFAETASADPPPCDSRSMYFVAHQDDNLLFQSPDLLQDIQSGRCVRAVFVTAGDAGRESSYWEGREEGVEAAYAQMAGADDEWSASQVDAAGRSVRLETLNGDPSVSVVFMRLPSGGVDGLGSERHGFQSPMKLWNGGNGGSPTIASTEAVDGSAAYTYQGLIDALAALMSSFEPSQVATQNYTQAFVGPDHADHVAVAYFTRAASALYGGAHRLRAFADYETSSQPQNVFGDLLGAKSFAFYTYGVHDDDACVDEVHCTGTEYAKWLLRQYVVASETIGAVADAGYDRTSSESTPVTLDGSQSSGESGEPLEYAWTQVGGPKVTLSGAGTVSPSLQTPSHPTVLTFSLTVSDDGDASAPDQVKVRVPSSDPTPSADAGPDQTVDSGSAVHLDGSDSWDPNALSLQYAWLQTAGPKVTLSGSSTTNPSFTAPTGPATLTFSLAVSNGSETSALSTVEVHVKGVPPAFASASATTFTNGVAKSFVVSTTGSPAASLSRAGALPEGLSFTDEGDGTATISGTAAASAAPPSESRIYPLTLGAESKAGEASQSFTLTVSNPEAPPPRIPPPIVLTPDDPPGAGISTARLSRSRVRLPTGRPSRRVVRVQSPPGVSIACLGFLPRGARCRVDGEGNVVVAGSRALRRAGAYRLTVAVASETVTVRRALIVLVRAPG
jgi:LmbE family N-acetylglucosaminyl deacetylase